MDIEKNVVPASPPPRYSIVVVPDGQQKQEYNYKKDPKYQCFCGIHVEVVFFFNFRFKFSNIFV
jgi:hypothetical protein